MFSVFRAVLVFVACLTLAACGGGSSGEGTNTSPEIDRSVKGEKLSNKTDADSYYLNISDSSYTGSNQAAKLNEASLLTFAAYVMGQDTSPETAKKLESSLTDNSALKRFKLALPISTEVFRSKRVLNHNEASTAEKPSYQGSSKSDSASMGSSESLIIDETISCQEGGSITYDGELDPAGQGLLQVSFNSCIESGVTTLGAGHIAYEYNNYQSQTVYYDNVKVFDDTGGAFLNGYISNTISINGIPTSTLYLTVDDIQTGEQLRFKNFVEATYNDQSLFFEGEIYLSNLGYINIRTPEYLSSNGLEIVTGKILFLGSGSAGELTFYSEDNAAILLDYENDGVFDTGATLSDVNNLSAGNHNNIEFIPASEINFPPSVYAPSIYSTRTNDTRSALYANMPYYTDPDGDPVTVVEYRWYRNGQLVMTTTTNELPPYTAFFGDTVSLKVLMTDGKHTVLSDEGFFLMGDAPSEIKVANIPDKVVPGETVSFTAQIIDPDLQGEATAAELVLAPEGMSIDTNGSVNWTPPKPPFAGVSTYRFTAKSPSDASVSQNLSITVVDSSVSMPIARSGIEVPKYNHSIHIGDFDGDLQNEVLTTDSIQSVMLLEKVDDEYKQVWMYPYSLPTSGTISQLLGYNLEGDEALEIIIATQKGISIIGTDSLIAETLLSYESEYIQAFAIGNIDGIGDPELAILVTESEYSSTRYLDIINVKSKERLKRVSVGSDAREVVIGNVDIDPQLEVITNDGLVYDGISLNNEWFYGQGFGDFISVGDVDNNGVDEIFGAAVWGDITLFDAQTKSTLWTLDNGNTCSILVANTDSDPQEEVIVGDCQWGNITAYEASSGSPLLEYQLGMIGHGSKSLAAGDSDNDGSVEVHWGTGQSSSGENQFVAAKFESSSVITNSNPSQLDWFTAAGWGDVSGVEKAIFIIPSTDSGYGGQTVALMDFNGDYSLSGQIDNNWEGGNFGVAVNYDDSGDSELFLASAKTYDGSFKALNLTDFSTIWTSGEGDYHDNISIVKAADINQDGNQDAIYVNNKVIEVIDIKNQVRLASNLLTTQNIQDIAIGDIDDDRDLDIAVATVDSIQVWSQRNGDFELTHQFAVNCQQIELLNLDIDSKNELACLSGDTYYYNPSTITTYDVTTDTIEALNSYEIGYPVTEIAANPNDYSALYIAIKLKGEGFGNEYGNLQQISMSSGTIIWNGPDFVGTVSKGSLFIRTEAQANGGAKLMFGTTQAMYLIP